MSRRIVESQGVAYQFSSDGARVLGGGVWAVLRARLVDELSNQTIKTNLDIRSDQPGLSTRVVGDGMVGLVGIPQQVFSYPDLKTDAHDFNVTLSAQGYLSHLQKVSIGPFGNFPDEFTTYDFGDVLLHRQPIVISGRVVVNGSSIATPLSGATVSVTGIWRQLPPADTDPPPDAPNVVALLPPLYFTRQTGTARLRRREMTPVMGEDKTLLEAVAQKNKRLKLSNRINLAGGDIIAIDVDDVSVVEYVTVAAIHGASTEQQVAVVSLEQELAFAHKENITVRKVLPQAPGGNNPFGVDAIIGDYCVFLNSMSDLAGTAVVEVSDGSQPDEYHRLNLFSAVTDSEGFFQLPLLSRLARLNIHVTDGTHSTNVEKYIPDYNRRENRLDIIVG